jgi:hypothetical protein
VTTQVNSLDTPVSGLDGRRAEPRSIDVASAIDRYVDRWCTAIDTQPVRFLAVLSAVVAAGTAARAWVRPLWFDELLALAVASQPSVPDIWKALAAGVDLHPPLHHVLSHAMSMFTGAGAWGLRLPAAIGFLILVICVFRFVERRTSPLYGAASAAMLLSTSAFEYATQGRPYGVMLGCAGIALLGWQSAIEKRRRSRLLPLLMLAGGLAGAISSSYHAVFVFVPFAAAEGLRTLLARRVDWPVFGAIAAGTLPLAGFSRLILAPLGYLETHAHAPGVEKMLDMYVEYLRPALIPMIATALLLLCTHQLLRPTGSSRTQRSDGHTTPELAAVLAFLLLPVLSFAINAADLTNVFFWVYLLPTVIGLSALAGILLFRWVPDARVAALFVLVALGWFSLRQASPLLAAISQQRVTPQVPELIRSAPPGLPVVVADPILFLQLSHYAPDEARARLNYVFNLEHVGRFTGQDSAERSMLDLATIRPVALRPYDDFIRTHQEFYLYWTGKRWEWLIEKLQEDNARVTVVRGQPGETLFHVAVASPAASR